MFRVIQERTEVLSSLKISHGEVLKDSVYTEVGPIDIIATSSVTNGDKIENWSTPIFSDEENFTRLLSISNNSIVLQARLSLSQANLLTRYFCTSLLIGFPIVCLVIFLLSLLLGPWQLRPFRQIIASVEPLLGTQGPVRPSASGDELHSMCSIVNNLSTKISDANHRLKRFAADISHELRTPLSVIQGEADYALRKSRSEKEYRDLLQSIIRESRYMSFVFSDLLLLARAQSQQIKMEWDQIDLAEFVLLLKQLLASYFEGRSITFLVKDFYNIDFYAHKEFLLSALKNILMNAGKFSKDGSTVTLDIVSNVHVIDFCISDQGSGIDADSLPYIFDAFYKKDEARTRAVFLERTNNQNDSKSGGSLEPSHVGLGLSLSKALIEMHGGEIKVTSQLGIGSRFCVSIPNYRTPPKI